LIQEVSEDEDSEDDVEMADVSKSNGHESETTSTVSQDNLSPLTSRTKYRVD